MSKKKVIIIEDNFDDFKDIRKYLDASCDCYPKVADNDSNSFEQFISLFQRCLNSGEKESIRNRKKKLLQTRLTTYGGDGSDVSYIIDYALQLNDTENVTGKKFYTEIISELYPSYYVPTLMLTGIDFNIKTINHINNELSKFKDKINENAGSKIFEFFRKNFESDTFKQDIITFITNVNSKPIKQHEDPENLTTIPSVQAKLISNDK